MESPSFLDALAGSFYSRDCYRGVAKEWRGKAFLYLLVLVVISCVLIVVSMYRGLATLREDLAPDIISQIPSITITNGVVSTDVEEPYTIVEPETGTPIAIIDTTGTVTSLEGSEAKLLLTQNAIITRKNETTTETNDLSGVSNFSMDGPMIQGWVEWGARWGPIILFPFILIGVYIYRIVQALFYAVCGLALNAIAGAKLEYPALLSLSMVAVTPAVALTAILGALGVEMAYAWLVCFALTMGFLYFGITATHARPGEAADDQDDSFDAPSGGADDRPASEVPRDIFMS